MPQPQHPPHSAEISRELKRDIVSGNVDFDRLARRIFNFQYQNNPPYRNYCQQRGCAPDTLRHWSDIPTVPTDAFKQHTHPLICGPASKITHQFHTSGTTTDTKGLHHFPSLELYDLSIVEAWRQSNLPIPHQSLILTPTPEEAPHSSLTHMMKVISDEFSEHSEWIINTESKIQLQSLLNAARKKQPLALLGTALAFLHLIELLPQPLKLPEGSWAMETGGYKGTERSMEKEKLYQLFEDQLGLAPETTINEYSMTELSSQFYTHGLGQKHSGPAWTKIRVVDPITQLNVPHGQAGHLAIYDLANLNSVMAIQTQDIAIAHGDNSFILLGRDPSAMPRGCSRAADHHLQTS